MARAYHYRRVLVMVREGHATPPPFRLAAELAHLLELELEGIFVEDEALVSLSAFPFARELRLPGHSWQALDAVQMLEDIRMQAGVARRLLAEAAASRGVASRFSVLHGDPHGALIEHGRPEDILVLVESRATIRSKGEDIFAAARSGVLLLPARSDERRRGIALLLPSAGAHAIVVAAAIARAAGEDLVLIVPEAQEASAAGAEIALRELGLPPARLRLRRIAGRDAGLIARALRAAGVRLVVLDRESLGEDMQGALARLLTEAGTAALLLGDVPPA